VFNKISDVNLKNKRANRPFGEGPLRNLSNWPGIASLRDHIYREASIENAMAKARQNKGRLI